MEDMSKKLNELLSSPGGIDKLKNAATALLGNMNNADQPISNPTNSVSSSDTPDLSDIDVGSLMKVLSKFNSTQLDDRSKLLISLKPHLSSDRCKRVDNAIKILKLVNILPLIKEQGFLNY